MTDAASGDRTNETPALELQELSKSFGAVKAARSVSFKVHRGEVMGLLGDNGAGKTTVVNCIAGSYQPDSGAILIDGTPADIQDPQSARDLGIETVYQDLALVETLDVTSNMFLGREAKRRWPLLRWMGWMDRRRMQRETMQNLEKLHINIPSVRSVVAQLSGGQRQAVSVGRAVAWGRHIVLLDEPAAALGVEQTELVLTLIRRLRDEGVAVVLISHNMHDVLEACDRVVVLRHGTKIGEMDDLTGVTTRHLVDMITGVTLGEGDVRHTEG
ncbi:MAG: ATP-binding cassette domain-containing protein [bacterium]|nr:ATP-binding cassette domain-containing protein [bacterium]